MARDILEKAGSRSLIKKFTTPFVTGSFFIGFTRAFLWTLYWAIQTKFTSCLFNIYFDNSFPCMPRTSTLSVYVFRELFPILLCIVAKWHPPPFDCRNSIWRRVRVIEAYYVMLSNLLLCTLSWVSDMFKTRSCCCSFKMLFTYSRLSELLYVEVKL
jgi:hypothetical protein